MSKAGRTRWNARGVASAKRSREHERAALSQRPHLLKFLVLTGLLLSIASTAEAVIVNGGFESSALPIPTPPGYAAYNGTPVNCSSLTGWCFTGTSGIDHVLNTIWTPADGSQSISLNWYSPSSISQTVSTIPGADYRVSFSMAAEHPAANAGLRTLAAYWGTVPSFVAPYTFNPAGNTNTSMGWECHSFVVQGHGSDYLRFTSTTPGAYGPALDAVCITNLVNGSFETPTGFGASTVYPAGSPLLTGWTIAGSSGIDHVSNLVWQAADGTESISLNWYTPSSISQTLTTVPGASYRVSFSLAAEHPADEPTVRTLRVWWGASVVGNYSFNPSGNTNASMGWQTYSLPVVGTGSDVLRFESTTPGAYGPALDNVVVDCCAVDRVACENSAGPACGGMCDAGHGTCWRNPVDPSTCSCQPIVPCDQAQASQCGGFCTDPHQRCEPTSDTATCACHDVPCDQSSPQTCGGTCAGQTTCALDPSGTHCSCSPPSCGASTAPQCGGTCPTANETCQPSQASANQCVCCGGVIHDFVSGVRWQDKTRIIWDPYVPPCPLLYNVHRIKARVLLDVDGNSVADDSGECFQHGLDAPEATDMENPPPGFTQFYQITRENSNGEGPLGPASNGLVPPNDHPCPSTLK